MEAKNNVRNWASLLDDATISQAELTARLPIVDAPVALMPDAHLGYGVTIGSVIATKDAIIPSAVGVDVGCGMHAERLSISADSIQPHLNAILSEISRIIPAGMGMNHSEVGASANQFMQWTPPPVRFTNQQKQKAAQQLGTLGSGNHFIEIAIDQYNDVCVVLHSGSRGIGNEVAQIHINGAKKDFAKVVEGYELEDPQLAWLVQGTPEFAAYWEDLQWLQNYAKENRALMFAQVMGAISKSTKTSVGSTAQISCHHNYAALENHNGHDVYVTRKGAINAEKGVRGIIPGSMGTSTYLTIGKGNPDSLCSCSHGAGRTMSRNQAKKNLTTDSLSERMGGRVWLNGRADALLDEHPDAYKDIDQVMEDQKDLVDITHKLESILNYKG